MGNRKKKYEAGEASNFMTRKRALKKLQLTLKDFRRLCILKGVFPREPRNRKRAQKGNVSKVSTLYYEKDIRFLLHEPIVNKFRDFKVFLRKLKKAQEKKNWDTVERLRDNKPRYNLDTIVKERYPTFIDAVRDLEDCLCLSFLYSTFPKTQKTPVEMVSLCKRLTTEFLHYVIEARALRKVFCSIKGYYFQAEIKGQTVTWIVPHSFGFAQPASVDMRLMSIFVEFYTTVLGFVNFRLFNSLNLHYPPTLATSSEPAAEQEDRVMALNQALARTLVEPDADVELDKIEVEEGGEAMEAARAEAEARDRQGKLFNGLRFFLGREVPREPLVFMVRAVGGEISWDATVAPGATFASTDPTITHQISDRPSIDDQVLGRFYVQPQWVFDSINRRERCGEAEYALGETLPPHLSPFIAERRVGDYVPPEQKKLEEGVKEDGEEEEEEEENEEEEESDVDEIDSDDEGGEEDEEVGKEKEDESMGVKVGTMTKLDDDHDQKMLEDEEYKLRVMMIKKKHRGLYRSMMRNRKKRMNEAKNMERKRKEWDDKNSKKAKKQKLEKPPEVA